MIRRWLYAGALILATLLLLLPVADVDRHMPLRPLHRIVLKGVDFRVVSGAGAQDEESLNIGSVGDDDNAVQTIALDHVGAEDYPLLRYGFVHFPNTLELSLVFRRADTPDDVHVVVLPRPESGTLSYDLRTLPAWHGDILEIGFAESPTAQLVARGQGFRPFTLTHAELWSPSVEGAVAARFSDWFAHWPWSQRSVHALGREVDTQHTFSLVLVAAAWCVIAILLGVLILGWRGARIGGGAAVCIGAAWLLLDLNWQSGLFWKLALSRDLYAGKSWAERSRTIADAPLLDVAARVRETLRDPSATPRIVVASDSDYLMLRLVYHLLPANVVPLPVVIPFLYQVDAEGRHPYRLPEGTVLVYYQVAANRFDGLHSRLHLADSDYPASVLLDNRALQMYRIEAAP